MKRLKHWFDIRRFSHRQKIHFTLNVAIGFMIIAFSHLYAHSPWSERVTDAEFDYFIRNEVAKTISEVQSSGQSSRMSKDIVFVDIDHLTFKKWGKPSVTPRDELAQILSLVAAGKPKVVVLDIFLNRKDYRPPEENEKFRQAIQAIQREKQTKVVVPVLVDSDKELVPTIIDDYFDEESCFRTVSTLQISQHDYVSRYWLPFEQYKGGQISGVSVLTSLLAYGDETSLQALQKAMVEPAQFLRFIGPAGEVQIKLAQENRDLYYQRIRFQLIPPMSSVNLGNLTTQVRKISEGQAMLTSDNPLLALKGKIVIIGNSSPDKGDIHRTALGDMPGMYVVGNAINTVSMGLQPKPVQSSIVLELLLVLVLAFIIVHTEDLGFLLLSLPLFIISSYLSYRYFLASGYFISAKFPAVIAGMGIHHFLAHGEETVHWVHSHLKKRKEHLK